MELTTYQQQITSWYQRGYLTEDEAIERLTSPDLTGNPVSVALAKKILTID